MPETRFLPTVLLLAASASVHADGRDPFRTLDLTPPRPALGTLTAAAPCQPRENRPLDLVDIVDLALCHNPQTREAWASARAAAAQLGLAEAAFLPTLDAGLGASRDESSSLPAARNTRSASVALSWRVFDFGARDAARDGARELLAAAAATQDDTVQSVFLAAVQAFYRVQATQAAVESARESERASRASFDAAEARYRVGVATPADRLQAQTAYSQAVLARIRAEGEARTAEGALAALLGRDAQRTVALVPAASATPGEGFTRDIEALVEEARRRRPDLRAAEAQARAAEANIEASRAAGRPSVNLGASANYQEFGAADAHGTSLGVSASIPIFSGFATTYRVRAAQAQAEVRAAQAERVRLQVALDVWNAYQNLVTSTQSLQTTADLLASAEQSARVALGRYQAGVGTILETLNAQSALASARQQRIQANYDWNIARATLAQAMGSLDLGLLEQLSARP